MGDTVSSVLLKILKKHGIRHVFGLPAAQIGLIMDGASKDPYFNYMTTRHEEACGHMAHAVGKLTDSMAVCFATVGPGATNMVPGVAAAFADNIPMLVLTPNNQAQYIEPGRDLIQTVDQLALYKPITKWNACIRQPERAAELIERAIHIARSGRPGPVHLDIPCDVAAMPCSHDLDKIPSIARLRPVPTAADLQKVVDLLSQAKRPVVVAGGGVLRSDGVAAFRALLDATGFVATTTASARGTVPLSYHSHVGSGGVLGGPAVGQSLSEADVILAVGCKFSNWMPINQPPLYPLTGQKVIQVDIDGEVLGRNIPLALGLQADAREFLVLLAAAMTGLPVRAEQDWIEAMRAEFKTYRQTVHKIADDHVTPGTNILNEAAFARAIAKLLPEDAVLALDGGQVMEWSQTFIHPRDPKSYIFPAGMGHLGIGVPAAVAAKSVHPDRPVVCITGDGALAMTIQEMETAARYGHNIIVIVGNDSHWGMYRPLGEHVFGNTNFGTKLTDVNFAKIAEGYGCYGERIGSLEELAEAFKRALTANKPTVLDIQVDFTVHPADAFWPAVVMRGVALAPVAL